MGAEIAAITTSAGGVRLDEPPPIDARIVLPPAIGRRFALFVDAEEEFDWHRPFCRDATTTRTIEALPEANAHFRARGCTPTYLVDWPIVANPASAAIVADLARQGVCDLGTQLHPWVNPPFDETVNGHNSYTGNLPLDLQRAKLTALTDKIAEQTGVRPRVYRAGRYGIGPHTGDLLIEQGYRLDCSVRACFDYRSQGGPDFSRHPVWPWRVGGGLYELPLTTAYTGLLRHRRRLPHFAPTRGILARSGLLDRVPLTPEGVRLADALAAIEQLLDDGQQLFSLSFHTPSLVPGHTPYVRDAADLKTFWAWWDGVFTLFERHGVTPIRSGDTIAAFDAA
ncbi:MAG: polysaccharide deacetylase family protein [Sphingomonadaceae bacterium]